MNRIARRYSADPIFCALLVGVLLLRALIPAGFMPGGDGLITVQLCTMQGPKTVTVPAPGEETPAQAAGDSWCPFALAASGAPLPSGTPPFMLARASDAVVSPGDAGLHSRTILRTQSARAPPRRA